MILPALINSVVRASTPSHAMPSTFILDVGLMAMLVVIAFSIVRMRSLFAIVMLQGAYSLLCAAWFVSLDAVDVAFTEAAVGAGISTVLMLGAMLLTDRQSSPVPMRKALGPFLVVLIAGAAMLYAVPDMPAYGAADSAANTGPGMEYMVTTPTDIDIPNVVTAVLASYRGYDTMGETVVIFMAGLGVLLLLGLNGNAGRWRAKPVGLNLSSSKAPEAKILRDEDDRPDEGPELEPDPPVKKPKPVVKKAASKKVEPQAVSSKKPTAKKATPKTAAKKPTAKKATSKKPAAKTAPVKRASRKTTGRKTGSKT